MSSLAAPSRRPTVTRRDTEVILSYYQSDLPGKDYLSNDLDDPVRRFEASRSRRRTNSNASSSSLYSTPNTPPTTHDLPPPLPDSTITSSSAPQSHRRRPSNQSTSDPDRRMAIVQSDTARFLPLSLDTVAGSSAHPPPSSKQTTASSSSTTTATKPTKPTSSQDPSHPRSHQPTSAPPKPRDADASQPLSHQRSMSDAVHANGTGTLRQRASNKNVHAHLTALSDGPGSSSSRSSSRPRTPEDATTADPPHAPSNAHSSGAPASNSGHRHRPYEPGLHSTAGPLPPPPRATIAVDATSPPPPRPPRLRSPSPVVRSSSDIGTPTIASVISPKASSSSLNLLNPDLIEKPLATVAEGSVAQFSAAQHHSERSSHHVREGAFQPSRILAGPSSRPSPNPQDTIRLVGSNGAATSMLSDGLPTSTTTHPFVDGLPASDSSPLTTPYLSSRPDVRRDPSWVSVHVPSDPPSEYPSPEPGPIPTTESPTAISFSPEPVGSASAPADQLPMGVDGLRSKKERGSPRVPTVVVGLLSDDKRNSSLPRTPSFVSTSTAQTRSPSPPPAPTPLQPPQPPRPPKLKIVSLWPEPMWCRDVLALRTPLERSQAYARKINDLAQYDSGLSAWVATTRAGARSAGSGRSLPKATSRAVSIKPIPRQVSRSSISSEATFPLRPDAYVATDLTTRTSDDLAPTTAPPPALPYPALANASSLTLASTSASTASSSNRLSFVPSHSQHQQQSASRALLERANVGGGFFSSIGRNYSMNARKDSSARSPVQHPPNRLIKAPPAGSGSPSTSTSSPTPASSSTTPRPALTSTPTVPGGPRAPPGRVARSQTLMLPPSPSQGSSSDGGSSPSPSPSQSVSLGPQPRRRSNTLKRPSLFGSGGPRGMPASGSSSGGGGSGGGGSTGIGPSSFQSFSQQGQDAKELAVDFQRQVDKLAELVPHADRDVLAGYLRRAGQDMLAIGQYLEDERSGSLRRD